MPGTIGNSGGGRLRGDYDASDYDGGPVKPSMSERESQAWDELIAMLPREALRKIDVFVLREAVDYTLMLGKIRQELHDSPAGKDLRCAKTQYTEKLLKLSGLLGMSPADRKRIQIAQPKEKEDDLSEFSEGT
jgi:hypothetical protein